MSFTTHLFHGYCLPSSKQPPTPFSATENLSLTKFYLSPASNEEVLAQFSSLSHNDDGSQPHSSIPFNHQQRTNSNAIHPIQPTTTDDTSRRFYLKSSNHFWPFWDPINTATRTTTRSSLSRQPLQLPSTALLKPINQ